MADLDIVIPVYNEGDNIIPVLESFRTQVKTSFRILICYDRDNDTTLTALATYSAPFEIIRVKNKGTGPHGAVVSGFEASRARAILVTPADDTFNAPIVDRMVDACRRGSDIVCASRFMAGGVITGYPFPKNFFVKAAAFTLYHVARLPTKDPTNGFRLFSRRVLDSIPIESNLGFTYSLELLVKCHRLGWDVTEVPAAWHERTHGESRFRVFAWLSAYLRWYFYAFITTYFRPDPSTVRLKKS